MGENLQAAFRNLVAALVAVFDAATLDGRRWAVALYRRAVVAARRRLARLAGMSEAEVFKRFPAHDAAPPAPDVPPETAPEAAPEAEVIELRPSEARRVAERRNASMFDGSSVVPPNIERAVTSQLQASHKNRMTHDELLRFLTAFGVPRGDARGALTVLWARTKRNYVIAEDLPDIQGWIGKGWIDSRKKSLGAGLASVVKRQLDIASDVALAAEVVVDRLVTRGYGMSTANDIAAKLCAERSAGAAG